MNDARLFSTGRADRDARFLAKDEVTVPILRALRVPDPLGFYAVLMPALHGPELYVLREKKVPAANIFAVDRNPRIHARYANPAPDDAHLVGVSTTRRPCPLHEAVEEVSFPWLNFVYIDLFGQPDASHLEALTNLFIAVPLAKGAVVLFTHGLNRGQPFACRLNKRLSTGTAAEAYVRAAALTADVRQPEHVRMHRYVSANINFQVTEVRF